MIVSDRARSKAVSAAATTAGLSTSPHGLWSPKHCFDQPLKSVRPLFAVSVPSASYTQWRGNGLAPTR